MQNFELRLGRQILLSWITQRKLPIDKVCFDVFRTDRVGARQRAEIATRVYAMVRYFPLWLAPDFSPEHPQQMRDFNERLEKYWKSNNLLADLQKEHLKAKPRFEDNSVEHFKKVHGVPHSMGAVWNDENLFHDYLQASLNEAPVSLRVLTSKIDAADALEQLSKSLPEAKTLRASRFTPACLVLSDRVSLGDHTLFQKGMVEIQDESSQWVSLLTGVEPGMRVLDLCAGAGGKSLHMADLMQGKGEIFAFDVDGKKIQRLMERARKSGFGNIRNVEHLMDIGQTKFDVVLMDAPCSSLGTLRRNPDLFFRLNEKTLRENERLQKEILLTAKKYLADKGRLIYATCTVRAEENRNVCNEAEARGFKSHPFQVHASAARYFDGFLTEIQNSLAFRSTGLNRIEALERAQLGWCYTTGESDSFSGDGFFVSSMQLGP